MSLYEKNDMNNSRSSNRNAQQKREYPRRDSSRTNRSQEERERQERRNREQRDFSHTDSRKKGRRRKRETVFDRAVDILSALQKAVSRNLIIRVGFAGALILLIVFCFARFAGCGAKAKTPEDIVGRLVREFENGNTKKIFSYYNSSSEDESLTAQIDAMQDYIGAHAPKSIRILQSDTLWEEDSYAFVCILYNLVLENDQEYPCIGTYMTQRQGTSYYIMPPSKITQNMVKEAAEAYSQFMETESYREYVKEYNTFIKKNPGYENKITGKLGL